MDGYIGQRYVSADQLQWAALIVEFENEVGATGTNKVAQGACYFGRLASQNPNVRARRLSCFPCFLLEVLGPYIRWVLRHWSWSENKVGRQGSEDTLISS